MPTKKTLLGQYVFHVEGFTSDARKYTVMLSLPSNAIPNPIIEESLKNSLGERVGIITLGDSYAKMLEVGKAKYLGWYNPENSPNKTSHFFTRVEETHIISLCGSTEIIDSTPSDFEAGARGRRCFRCQRLLESGLMPTLLRTRKRFRMTRNEKD